jgi:hypothetical protein
MWMSCDGSALGDAMKKISNSFTFSLKLFPFVFYGFLAFMVVLLCIHGAVTKAPLLLAVPCAMGVMAYSFVSTTLRDLADEVYDCGDFLLVRKRGEEDNVPLSNIMNVKFVFWKTLPRIILALDAPGKFGTEIVFATPPQLYLGACPKNKIVEDLIVRVHQARSGCAVNSPAVDPSAVCQ